ncbi:hypothetical protein Goshw_008998, partial [Gossypium schwendimanii]|nr:hypothetical protein [Gossypium schwendimanii]
KVTNELKGDATVTYEDPHVALAAVEWFNDKDFHESTIGIFMAESKSSNAGVDVPTVGVDGGGFEDDVAKDIDGGGVRGNRREIGSVQIQGASCGGGVGGCGRGHGTPYSGGHGRAVAVTGATRDGFYGVLNVLTFPTLPMLRNAGVCGNINWAKRMKCNICNTNKPDHNEGDVRY